MSLVATQEGCAALWQQLLGLYAIGAPVVRLLGQAYQPQHTDTLATYAARELVAAGYAPIQLLNPFPNWQVTELANGAQAAYPGVVWNLPSGATIYGYWLNDASGTFSLWAEAFATPYNVTALAPTFTLVLSPTLTSQP